MKNNKPKKTNTPNPVLTSCVLNLVLRSKSANGVDPLTYVFVNTFLTI